MESVNLRIQNWEVDEVEEISYSISLKLPFKEDLLRLLPTHLVSKLQYNWQFGTGILSTIQHSLRLCLYREYHEPKLGVFISINNSVQPVTPPNIIEVKGIDVTFVTNDSLNLPVEDSLSQIDPPKAIEIPGTQFWHCTSGWPDRAVALYLIIHVIKRKPPCIVNDDDDQLSRHKKAFYNGQIDIKPYFMSSDCADVLIQCGNSKLPAHRLILSSRSKYFSTMFSVSMKESREGLIKIEDMTPVTVKEMLRFIYQGEIEDLDQHSKDLFIAADKYGMDDLKALCEQNLVEKLKVENALEIYDLCQLHGSDLLLRKSKQIILWNKGKFAPDSETLKDFTLKYPQLMFELFKFET